MLTTKQSSKILEKFVGYCIPHRNITWERHVLNTRNQHDRETINQYVTDLNTKALMCEFKDLKDSLIQDQMVCGINCDATRSRFWRTQLNTTKGSLHLQSQRNNNISDVILYCDRCGNWNTK